jgi:hypothetical protein
MIVGFLLACSDGGDDSATPAEWTVLGHDLPSAVLSIHGDDTDDLWLVGSDIGRGPYVRHHTASGWAEVDTGTSGDLWWAWDDGADVWMVGAGGRVVRGDGSTFVEEVLDPEVTLFGIWGSSPSDVWTVGGNIAKSSAAAAMWHYDGTAWSPAGLPKEAKAKLALYKVWGRSSSEVYVVGSDGLLLQRAGFTWNVVPTATSYPLFTVHGDANRAYAVGGEYSGAIAAQDAGSWTDDTPSGLPQMNGVYVREGCDPVAVGTQGGQVFQRTADGWVQDERPSPTPYDFHAAWVSPDCEVLAVGGYLTAIPMSLGVVVWSGGSDLAELP